VNSVLADNGSDGLLAAGGGGAATVSLAGSDVTGNGTDVNIAGGTVFSYGDNEIGSVKGTLTPLAKK
jgi:hypothetical protein